MKFEITKNNIDKYIQKLSKVSTKHLTLPVLSCVYIKADKEKNSLLLKATNLDLGVEININTKIIDSGLVAVPGNLLSNAISSVGEKENILFESVEGNLKISSNKNNFVIKCLPHDDFPSIPKVEENNEIIINSKDLQNGLRSVWYSASQSAIKPELASVYVFNDGNHLNFVSTDSFRLAEKKIHTNKVFEFNPILIPAKNISEILRIIEDYKGDIKILLDKNQISFEFELVYIVSRLIDGSFPDYTQIVPKSSSTVATLLKADLLESLKTSHIFSDSLNKVKIVVNKSKGLISIESKNTDTGEFKENIKANIEGDDVELSFNQKYIADCFQSIFSDSIKLEFNGPGKALVISGPADKSFLYLVMPMNR